MALRRELLLGMVAAFVLLGQGQALAAPTWLGAEPLDPGFSASVTGPDVTTDPDGNSAAVWIGSGGEVNAAVRPRGGSWGAPQNLEPGGQVQTEDAPHVVAEPDGEFVAVWVGDLGGTSGNYIRWAHKPPGQDWSAPAPIAQTLTNAALLALEVGAAGDATVLWTDRRGNTSTSTKPAGSDAWEAADPLPNTGDPTRLALTVSADGATELAYPSTCTDLSFLDCVLARYRPAGGDWSLDEVAGIANAANTEVTGVAINSRADPVRYTVVWGEDQTTGPQTPPGRVASADRSSGTGGTWDATATTVVDLLAAAPGCPTNRFGCIDLASHDDTLAAVWQQGDDGTGESIAASVRTGNGAWGAGEGVGDVGNGDAFPQVALTADGTAVAAWGDGPSGSAVARASHRVTDGTWTQQAIGTPAEGAAVLRDVVADGLGDAVTAWSEPGGMQAAGFDGTGPRFTAFSLPSGSLGEAPFAADADDNWSPPASIAWRFGDGAGAAGASVTHAYGAPGTFTATATATDAIGNTTALSGTVAVTAEPTPTPTPDPCGTGDKDKDGVKDGCDTNDGSARPIAFKTVNATVVSGEVFVKLPAGAARAAAVKTPKGFVRLTGAETIPVGSTLDTAHGRVKIRSAADTRKHVQTGQFFRGRFRIGQVRKPRGKAKKRSTKLITDLRLTGSSFSRTCRKTTVSVSAKRRSKKRVRRLFGDGKGSFRTRGRNAAATVRGTRWSVQDRCDGTLVTVQRGRVEVRDLVRHRTVFVRTGHTYLARRR